MLKKSIVLLALIVALTATSVCLFAQASTTFPELPSLSSMTQDQQIDYLHSQNIKIPDNCTEFVLSLIPLVEKDPNFPIVINNPKIYKLGLDVREAVNCYYNRTAHATSSSPLASNYVLSDSTVYGAWLESHQFYNCYAYAVNRTDSFYWPGKFSTVKDFNKFNISDSIYDLALDVKADLSSSTFSNKCIRITTTRPSSVASGQSCICIRKGPIDFHFMKFYSSFWCHKPGGTNPLKYKYLPSTSRVWTNECSIRGISHSATTQYNSTIYYIIYQKNHSSTTYTSTGNNYHSGSLHYYEYGDKCNSCGAFSNRKWVSRACSGPPCPSPFSVVSEIK